MTVHHRDRDRETPAAAPVTGRNLPVAGGGSRGGIVHSETSGRDRLAP